ncbi:hypothetical protein HYT01_03745 [Candidatus Giovannonibacteria bacterium]|nr:hypothetical protein [Candidatus Giovannonibacteria bacterium]
MSLKTEVTPEVQAAKEHVNICASCQWQMGGSISKLDKAGLLPSPLGERSNRELAASFRRRARKLHREREEQSDEHVVFLGVFLDTAIEPEGHSKDEVQAALKHVDNCEICKRRIHRLADILEQAGVLYQPKGGSRQKRG